MEPMTGGDILAFGILFSPIWLAALIRMKTGSVSGSASFLVLLVLNLMPILGLTLLFGIGGFAFILPVLALFLGLNLVASASILTAFGKPTASDRPNPK